MKEELARSGEKSMPSREIGTLQWHGKAGHKDCYPFLKHVCRKSLGLFVRLPQRNVLCCLAHLPSCDAMLSKDGSYPSYPDGDRWTWSTRRPSLSSRVRTVELECRCLDAYF